MMANSLPASMPATCLSVSAANKVGAAMPPIAHSPPTHRVSAINDKAVKRLFMADLNVFHIQHFILTHATRRLHFGHIARVFADQGARQW